jgi:Fur family transcriptional regulator, peroxide stress response regulator
MKPTRDDSKLEQLVQACRREGLPLTVQRRAVLEGLLGRHDHPTADQLYDEVRSRMPGISRTTVYRVLDTLVKLSLARRVPHPGAAASFEAQTHRHHHLVCNECGTMVDLEDSSLDNLPLPGGQRRGFIVSDYSVQFRGICLGCARRKPPKRQKA